MDATAFDTISDLASLGRLAVPSLAPTFLRAAAIEQAGEDEDRDRMLAELQALAAVRAREAQWLQAAAAVMARRGQA